MAGAVKERCSVYAECRKKIHAVRKVRSEKPSAGGAGRQRVQSAEKEVAEVQSVEEACGVRKPSKDPEKEIHPRCSEKRSSAGR